MNSRNLTTVPLPPATESSIGRNRADQALGLRSRGPDAASKLGKIQSPQMRRIHRPFRKGDKALVGNTGFRRYLKTISEEHFAINPDKIEAEKKFDGIFVLRTNNRSQSTGGYALYKQLWTVEQTFRTA